MDGIIDVKAASTAFEKEKEFKSMKFSMLNLPAFEKEKASKVDEVPYVKAASIPERQSIES